MRKLPDFILDTIAGMGMVIFLALTVPQLLFVSVPRVQIFSYIAVILPDPRHVFVGWVAIICAIAIAKKMLHHDYRLVRSELLETYHPWFVALSITMTFYLASSYGFLRSHPILIIVMPLACYVAISVVMTVFSNIQMGLERLRGVEENLNQSQRNEQRLIYIIGGVTFWIVIPVVAFLSYRFIVPKIQTISAPYLKSIIISKRSPHIDAVRPSVAYPSSRVVITGRNFGYLQNNNDAKNILSIGGRAIPTDSWKSDEIVITLPLDLPPKLYEAYISAAVEYNGSTVKTRSNTVQIEVLSRTDGWDEQDDKFFQQQ